MQFKLDQRDVRRRAFYRTHPPGFYVARNGRNEEHIEIRAVGGKRIVYTRNSVGQWSRRRALSCYDRDPSTAEGFSGRGLIVRDYSGYGFLVAIGRFKSDILDWRDSSRFNCKCFWRRK
jgi:hypothetical protein